MLMILMMMMLLTEIFTKGGAYFSDVLYGLQMMMTSTMVDMMSLLS